MFLLDVEKEKWALKPMNCPGHCLIFDSRDRSYRELPIRMAEFGIIHRNEASGALTGLTRVRRFVQDDTHVFCMPSQLEGEIRALFDFMEHVYGLFGFEFRLELSTRPENYLGTIETWNAAEEVRGLSVDGGSCVDAFLVTATQTSSGQTSPRKMGIEPWGRGVLRAQDRHHHSRCLATLIPMRHHSA